MQQASQYDGKNCIQKRVTISKGVCHTAISRKVVRKNVHATISKGNMGYVQYTVPDTVAFEPAFLAFLQHSQTYVHGLFCHSIKCELKTTHNTFRAYRVHFIRQLFSKQPYMSLCGTLPNYIGKYCKHQCSKMRKRVSVK